MRPWTASSWSGCRRRSVHREGRGRRIWRTGGGFAGSPVRSGVSPGAGGTFFPLQRWCRKWRKMDFAGKELYGVPLDKENNPASRNGFWNGQVNQFESGGQSHPGGSRGHGSGGQPGPSELSQELRGRPGARCCSTPRAILGWWRRPRTSGSKAWS